MKKFVLSLNKSKPASNGSEKASADTDNKSKSKATTNETGGNADAFELRSDLPEISRNSLDSRLEKSKKSEKAEKSRMSTDRVDRFRRRRGLVW